MAFYSSEIVDHGASILDTSLHARTTSTADRPWTSRILSGFACGGRVVSILLALWRILKEKQDRKDKNKNKVQK